ncbi:MAG: hypothetical protein AAFW70_19145, partial [Cyanobacteria bacterium J06635_10]
IIKSPGHRARENCFMSKFIVYACPVGELATQLELYFQTSEVECGKNTAHKYMPHCTLTGFFEDELTAIPIYIEALDDALKNSLSKYSKPLINILSMTFKSEWHGLELHSPTLKRIIADFAKTVNSPTRHGELRLKDWLHLSLAYEFRAKQKDSLKIIAEKIINTQASVQWELRFYQLHSDWTWTCHKSWML